MYLLQLFMNLVPVSLLKYRQRQRQHCHRHVFDATTGTISGTPTAITLTASYMVTATNSGGTFSFEVVITVNDLAPLH
jgi:hypothetical protein